MRDFGTGGTGEMVVPEGRLRRIDDLDLSQFTRPPETRPTTVPTTGPDTVPTTLATSEGTEPIDRDTPRARERPITLTDVRAIALQHNLDLKVELLNPVIARQSITEEQARYEAVFTANVDYSRSTSPTASQLAASESNSLLMDAGVELPLITGGLFRFAVPLQRFETDNAFTFLNPSYTAGPAISFSQPLLRGAGFDVNAQPIRVAFYQYQQVQARTKLEVIRVLADAERAYWRLFAARMALEVRKEERKLAVEQLDRARRELREGAGIEVDVLRAASGVADADEAIIVAENAVRDRQRELKRILNDPEMEIGGTTVLIPAAQPVTVAYNLRAPKLVEVAMAQRMDLLEEELRIAEQTAAIRVAKNDMLPLVSFEYTYGVNGLGPSFDDALSQVRDVDFEDHRFGLRVQVPIGNEAARSRFRRATYTRLQSLATKQQRELQIRQEVYNAVDNIEAGWQRVQAARVRVDLAQRVYDGERRQFDAGRRTSTEVNEANTNLTDARSSLIVAATEYQIAQVDLAFATGTILGANAIVWEPTAPPEAGPK